MQTHSSVRAGVIWTEQSTFSGTIHNLRHEDADLGCMTFKLGAHVAKVLRFKIET